VHFGSIFPLLYQTMHHIKHTQTVEELLQHILVKIQNRQGTVCANAN